VGPACCAALQECQGGNVCVTDPEDDDFGCCVPPPGAPREVQAESSSARGGHGGSGNLPIGADGNRRAGRRQRS
jgi:hypothetical protein